MNSARRPPSALAFLSPQLLAFLALSSLSLLSPQPLALVANLEPQPPTVARCRSFLLPGRIPSLSNSYSYSYISLIPIPILVAISISISISIWLPLVRPRLFLWRGPFRVRFPARPAHRLATSTVLWPPRWHAAASASTPTTSTGRPPRPVGACLSPCGSKHARHAPLPDGTARGPTRARARRTELANWRGELVAAETGCLRVAIKLADSAIKRARAGRATLCGGSSSAHKGRHCAGP